MAKTRKNFPSRVKRRLTKVIENLTKRLNTPQPAVDEEHYSRKMAQAKRELETVTAKLAGLG